MWYRVVRENKRLLSTEKRTHGGVARKVKKELWRLVRLVDKRVVLAVNQIFLLGILMTRLGGEKDLTQENLNHFQQKTY